MTKIGILKDLVIVKRSSIHGRGLFAACAIRKGSLIGVFEGDETSRDGAYVLWVFDEDDNEYGIRGKNELRFTNHSARPNADFRGDELWALRAIKEGDEITFDYGPEWH